MELQVKDSKAIKNVLFDAFVKAFGDQAGNMYSAFDADGMPTNELMVNLNDIMTKAGYMVGTKKKLLDYVSDEFLSFVSVSLEPDRLELVGRGQVLETVRVRNSFDVPLVFSVSLEDRDALMEIIYDKTEDRFVNTLSQEAVIDAGKEGVFRFRLANTKGYSKKDSILLVVVRSRDLDLLNVINKLPVHVA